MKNNVRLATPDFLMLEKKCDEWVSSHSKK